jgi:hypothetical protein
MFSLSFQNPCLRILQYGYGDHERSVAKILGLSLPRPGETINVSNIVIIQNFERERLKVTPKDEVLGLGLLTTRIRVDQLCPLLFYDCLSRMHFGARILIPFPPAKKSSAGFWPDPAPLFEKERNIERPTLVPNFDDPFFRHRPRSRSAFAADNGPINAG